MAKQTIAANVDFGDLRSLINADAAELSSKLQAHQIRTFPPSAKKTIRRLAPGEAAKFIGIHEGYLRQLAAEGKGPPPRPMGVGPIRSMMSIKSAWRSIMAAKARNAMSRIAGPARLFRFCRS